MAPNTEIEDTISECDLGLFLA